MSTYNSGGNPENVDKGPQGPTATSNDLVDYPSHRDNALPDDDQREKLHPVTEMGVGDLNPRSVTGHAHDDQRLAQEEAEPDSPDVRICAAIGKIQLQRSTD